MAKKKDVVILKVEYVPCPPEKINAYKAGMVLLIDLMYKFIDEETKKMPQTG